ncbi:MAG: hypothetical protein JSR45_10975 [Proteobacteria bacterium]|nr:hypothetical protein [Pseudomonadota bacterium]
MTVSPDGPRRPAQPPRAADASQSAFAKLTVALRDALAPGLAMLGRAWRELVEIERRASGEAPAPQHPPSPHPERDRSQ